MHVTACPQREGEVALFVSICDTSAKISSESSTIAADQTTFAMVSHIRQATTAWCSMLIL